MSKRSRQPKRPKGFALTRHPRGYWRKKVLGRIEYFGRVDSAPEGTAALEEWL